MESPNDRMIKNSDTVKRGRQPKPAKKQYCRHCGHEMAEKGRYWECPSCLEAKIKTKREETEYANNI